MFPNFTGFGLAPCATVDNPDMFNHDEHIFGAAEVTAAAKAVCTPCPYIKECFSWAMANAESGVWGGTSERERKKMKRISLYT